MIMVNIQVTTIEVSKPSLIAMILNGMMAKRGKKLKKDSADLPNTKCTTVERFTGKVSKALDKSLAFSFAQL